MSRKSKPLKRGGKGREIKKIYIIATEGKETEKIYFNILKKDRHHIHFDLLPTAQNGNSSPKHVLKRVSSFKTKYQSNSSEIWLVIDKDSWTEEDLNKVKTECQKKGFNFSISNPCFEVWLLMHYGEKGISTNNKVLKSRFKAIEPNYYKHNFKSDDLKKGVTNAIEKAKRDHNNSGGDQIPGPPNTTIYNLVEDIISQ